MGIRVVLAEDSLLVREEVCRLLDHQPDIEVVGTCADLPELMAAVDATPPDVVITDVRMPPTSSDEGIQAAAQLRRGPAPAPTRPSYWHPAGR